MIPPKNLGTAALELHKKEICIDPLEAGEGISKRVSKLLDEVIKTHKNFGKEYYIQIIFQQENFHKRQEELANIYHLQETVTSQDPGMRPDRSCWKYNNQTDQLIYLWALPDLQSCAFIIKNENALAANEQQLLGHVKQFFQQCCSAIMQKNIMSLNKEEERCQTK